MGTTMSGMAGVGSQSAMMGTVSTGSSKKYNRASGSRSGSKKTTPKKKLNYNPREISGQLVRVKKSQSASVVLTRAKARVALLMRQSGSGQYDRREVANAVAHAQRMVRCAQLKVRNLKSEEMEQKGYDKKHGAKDQQSKGEVKRRIAQKERQLESKIAAKEMQETMRQKREYREMMQRRRMHRTEEQSKINEADMKYIKGMLEQGRSGYDAVRPEAVLKLSAHAAALAELQRLETERQQLEQEMESSEAAVETSVDQGGGMDMSMVSAEVANEEAAPVPEAAVSVDVVV